ncbi:MAG: ComEC/Rec2 family competence protein, partial [Verrucomicrobia bacterium]|nr:ComEC/Rec2 family competence protein [Verrucomicrobiota bacterium]
MVWVAGAFVAGLGAASVGVFPGWLAPLALLVAAILVAWGFSARSASRSSSISMAAFAAGVLLWNAQHTGEIGDPLSRYVAENPQQDMWTVEGVVRLTDLENSQSDQRLFVLDVDTVHVAGKTLALHGATTFRQFQSADVVYATQRFRVTGRLTTAIGRVNPNLPGYEGYARSKGIHTALDIEAPEDVEVLSDGRTWSVAYWASRLRRVQAERMARSVPESALGFANAIWLGYRSQMSAAENQTYIESGTYHILSVSGIHMAMVFYTALMLASMVTKSRRKQAIFAIVALGLFTLMSGLRA